MKNEVVFWWQLFLVFFQIYQWNAWSECAKKCSKSVISLHKSRFLPFFWNFDLFRDLSIFDPETGKTNEQNCQFCKKFTQIRKISYAFHCYERENRRKMSNGKLMDFLCSISNFGILSVHNFQNSLHKFQKFY